MSQFNIQDIIDRYQQLMDQANAANEGRYQQGLGWYDDQFKLLQQGYGSARKDIMQVGRQALSDIQRQTAERQGMTMQSTMDRGFFNSSVLDALQNRNVEEGNRATADVQERIAGLRSGLTERQTGALAGSLGDKIGFLERRTDLAPNFRDLIPLIQQYYQSQAYQPSGGGNAFLGVNPSRFSTPGNDFYSRVTGGGAGGGSGGYGGGGGYGSSFGGGYGHPMGGSVFTVTGGGGGGGSSNNIWDIQQRAQQSVNSSGGGGGGGDTNQVIPATTWFQNPNMRIQGDYVYDARTGRLLGRKGNIGG